MSSYAKRVTGVDGKLSPSKYCPLRLKARLPCDRWNDCVCHNGSWTAYWCNNKFHWRLSILWPVKWKNFMRNNFCLEMAAGWESLGSCYLSIGPKSLQLRVICWTSISHIFLCFPAPKLVGRDWYSEVCCANIHAANLHFIVARNPSVAWHGFKSRDECENDRKIHEFQTHPPPWCDTDTAHWSRTDSPHCNWLSRTK